ncbi:MAG TPA: hypothetical protein VN682_15555 [Terriglobales bacterium]|nr:hypothetical protein [Terriglobales bacterium]
MHPKSEEQHAILSGPPNLDRLEQIASPYSGVIDVLRSALKQVQQNLALNPNDQQSAEIQRSFQRMLDDLETAHPHGAA